MSNKHSPLPWIIGGGILIGAALAWGSNKPVPATPAAAPPPLPKAKFRAGDTVTVTGGAKGDTTTYKVKLAVFTPSGWEYTLDNGAVKAQTALHLVEPV